MDAVNNPEPKTLRRLENERYQRDCKELKRTHNAKLAAIDDYEQALRRLAEAGLSGNGQAKASIKSPRSRIGTQKSTTATSPLNTVRAVISEFHGSRTFNVHDLEKLIGDQLSGKSISQSLFKLTEGSEIIAVTERGSGKLVSYRKGKLRTDLMENPDEGTGS